MRPAYRYASGSVAVVLLGAAAWWWLARSEPGPVELLPVRPQGIEPLDAPLVGAPTAEEQALLLDKIEEYEAREFGATEAARRRRLREQILRDRVQPRPR